MENCEICEHIIHVCKNLGKENVCKTAIDDLEQNKITIKDLMDTIEGNFDKELFKKEWDRLVDEKTKE